MEQRIVLIKDRQFEKDAQAVLDFSFDWTDWLETAEIIVTAVTSATTGITINSTVPGTKAVVVWLSGGSVGIWYNVTCRITTSAGRTDQRSIQILITNR